MKRAVGRDAGYTIVETMIFLIVSGLLMASAALLFNGKIQRSQFVQSVRNLDSQIKNTINDVSTGTYAGGLGYKCTPGAANQPTIIKNGSSDAQGTNSGCIFVGKVLQLGATGDKTTFNIYTIAGNRLDISGSGDVTSLAASHPVAVDDSTSPQGLDLTNYSHLQDGLQVDGVFAKDSNGTTKPVGSIGIFQTFGQVNAIGTGLVSGSQNVQVTPIGTNYPLSQGDLDTAIKTLAGTSTDASEGIIVCLSGGANQTASLTIGLNNSGLATTLAFNGSKDGACS